MVEKLPSGTFRTRVMDDSGITHRKSFKTIEEADEQAKAWRIEFHKEYAWI